MPLQIEPDWVESVRQSIPELPDARRQRFVMQYGLPAYDAEVLVASRAMADYYEAAVALFPQPKMLRNWVMGDFLRELNHANHSPDEAPATPSHLAELLRLIDEGTISGKIAKTVFEDVYRTGKRPKDIVAEQGLVQMRRQRRLAGGHRAGSGRTPRTGCRVSRRQGQTARLLRRPDHEGDARQGQPGHGQHVAEATVAVKAPGSTPDREGCAHV